MGILLAAVSGIGLDSRTVKILLAGMIIYMLVMLFIGWHSSRKVNGMSDFLVAGRRLPLWMATATLLATWFGAGSSMGVAATVYSDGLNGVLADPFGASVSLILAGVFIVGVLRKKGCMTVTDIIERRFHDGRFFPVKLFPANSGLPQSHGRPGHFQHVLQFFHQTA